MRWRDWWERDMVVVALCVRALLLHMYVSTDFEVHRHWMALTWHRPLADWYVLENISPWTLDYPPLFAYFERALAQAAVWIDPSMISPLEALGVKTPALVAFQRATVALAEIPLFLAARELTAVLYPASARCRALAQLSVLFHAGVLLVDHVHFQYNTLPLGAALLALAAILRRNHKLGGVLFACALNLKQTTLCYAPAVAFCVLISSKPQGPTFSPRTFASALFRRCCAFGSAFALCTLAVWAPFLRAGQLAAVFRRLFPFERGLLHAFWAPNLWALYATADLLLASNPLLSAPVAAHSATRGRIGASNTFAVLPPISPRTAAALAILAILPSLLVPLLRSALLSHRAQLQSAASMADAQLLTSTDKVAGLSSTTRGESSCAKNADRMSATSIGVAHNDDNGNDDDDDDNDDHDDHDDIRSTNSSGLVERDFVGANAHDRDRAQRAENVVCDTQSVTIYRSRTGNVDVNIVGGIDDAKRVGGESAEIAADCIALSARAAHVLLLAAVCGWSAFAFGFHVHEKAILLATVPLAMLAPLNTSAAVVLSAAGHYALLTLFTQPRETAFKLLLLATFCMASHTVAEHTLNPKDDDGDNNDYSNNNKSKSAVIIDVIVGKNSRRRDFWRWLQMAYIGGLVCLELYLRTAHVALGLHRRLPFSALGLISAYSALGVLPAGAALAHQAASVTLERFRL
mmetsp:Transcript_12772/g.34339  ORF Transcript_12772/g.34339 Transcript_12772/m.34339 type:complete len:692 (+) Transcript_12772:40-2115(+)